MMLGSTQWKAAALPTGRDAQGTAYASRPRRTCVRGSPLIVQSVLGLNKGKGSNGAGAAPLDAKSVEDDVLRELHYRLAADRLSVSKLYSAVAWSVHNRLVDAWEQTHAYWK
jgi:hypothetical protein